ncbi:PUA-like domain-containing protein [Xylariaceae sp. AK1471]|nr:PUA-like domain-containing protein [Xylariaceae sp. AK1471]
MPKRKATQLEAEPESNSTLRRSTRRKSFVPSAAANENTARSAPPTSTKEAPKLKSDTKTLQPKSGKVKAIQKAQTKSRDIKPVETPKKNGGDTSESSDRWYWLMKAEPESRFENDVDVRFSIDDLASRTEPEPWDGIRAYAARNNLRSMKKGELAFFYHSNCKEPGIVGTMEIVQEHSPDVSAHEPKAPYYDPSSKPEDPKWSVVHVKFRSKFTQPIGLKELREMGKPGKPLENMQMLKQTRLSVSRVSPSEWEHLMDLVQKRGGEVSKTT